MGSPAAGVAAGTWTSIGNLGSPALATVDPRGLVTPRPGGWSLDWWIGADDRWHVPAREVAVRQRLLDSTPVVETAMRIPGGDAVQRVYAIRASSPDGGADELVVVEIENRSRLPVAVAFGIRPSNPGGPAAVETIVLDGATVMVDGRVGLLLPKRPPRVAVGTADAGDSVDAVLAGEAGEDLPGPVHDPNGGAQAAFVFPLPHTATLRVALPFGAARDRRRPPAFPAALPAAANVAAGWQAQTRRGLQLDLPDARWQEAVDANRRFLLLFAGREEAGARPNLVTALDEQGFHDEAVDVLTSDGHQRALTSRSASEAAAAVWALGEHWRLTGDRASVEAMVEPIARAAHTISRRRPKGTDVTDATWAAGLQAAAEMLAAVGEVDAARAASASLGAAGVTATSGRPLGSIELDGGLPRLAGLFDAAGPTWTWSSASTRHDPETAAELLRLVRGLFVRDTDDGLALCSVLPAGWEGRGFEVRQAPSHAGPISYGVRWHGDRPAILWELQPRGSGCEAVLRAPGLDPQWSTTAASGEALLAPFCAPARSFA